MSSNRKDLYTKKQKQIVIKMLAKGASAREIGEKIGRTRASVIGKCDREGWEFQKKKQTTAPKKIKSLPKHSNKKALDDILTQHFDESPKTAMNLMDTGANNCLWPYMNGLFCGAHKEKEVSYCQKHLITAHETKKTDQPQKKPKQSRTQWGSIFYALSV